MIPKLTLAGCKEHPHRTDLSCCKIRREDGTALTNREVMDVIEGLLKEIAQKDAQITALFKNSQ